MSEPVYQGIGRPYSDWSTGLIVVGMIQLLIALLCLMGCLAMAGLAATTPEAGPILPAVFVYLLLAAAFGTLGLGNVRRQRWARTLSLIGSWIWLVSGIFGLTAVMLMMQGILRSAGASAEDAEASLVFSGCMYVGAGIFYIVLPGVMVLFFGHRNTRATAEARDPHVRWTDRCPAPLLALSLLTGYGAASFLLLTFYPAVPFFGGILTGFPKVAFSLVLAAVMVVIAVGLYRRQIAAWWALLVFGLLGMISSAFLFRDGTAMREFYASMGLGEADLNPFLEIWSSPGIIALMIAGGVTWLGYVIWTRRFFGEIKPETPPEVAVFS
jgi:hypothetical protein